MPPKSTGPTIATLEFNPTPHDRVLVEMKRGWKFKVKHWFRGELRDPSPIARGYRTSLQMLAEELVYASYLPNPVQRFVADANARLFKGKAKTWINPEIVQAESKPPPEGVLN